MPLVLSSKFKIGSNSLCHRHKISLVSFGVWWFIFFPLWNMQTATGLLKYARESSLQLLSSVPIALLIFLPPNKPFNRLLYRFNLLTWFLTYSLTYFFNQLTIQSVTTHLFNSNPHTQKGKKSGLAFVREQDKQFY